MPLLPSGKNFYISNNLILEPNNNFFTCPEGHFWYQTPDLAINAPPFEIGPQIIMDFAHAPVPVSRDEAKGYIQVLVCLEDDRIYWRGKMLSDFPGDGELDEADLRVWNEWLKDEGTVEFLDQTIEKCRIQAESNKHNAGSLTMHETPGESTPPPDELRLQQIGIRGNALEAEAAATRAANDEKRGMEIYHELEALLDETATVRRQFDQEGGIGAYLEGYLNRILYRWESGEKSFREYLSTAPFDIKAWLELTWCLSGKGDLADAEVAARRGVKVATRHSGAWANLSGILIQLGKRDEARQALDRALELDPDDPNNRNTDEHFDDYFKPGEPPAETTTDKNSDKIN